MDASTILTIISRGHIEDTFKLLIYIGKTHWLFLGVRIKSLIYIGKPSYGHIIGLFSLNYY